jgi:hypothetical protein
MGYVPASRISIEILKIQVKMCFEQYFKFLNSKVNFDGFYPNFENFFLKNTLNRVQQYLFFAKPNLWIFSKPKYGAMSKNLKILYKNFFLQ